MLFWAICGGVSAGVFHDPSLHWQTIESSHFRIHYHDGEAALAQRFWPKAEKIYTENTALLDWHPKDKVDVVLTDEFDLSNGFTRVFPYNSIVLYVSAPDAINSLEEYNDWLTLVFRHEFLHVVHLDKVKGAPAAFQGVFGRHPFLFPNAYQPRWVIEGLATYTETDNGAREGRGQSAYFDMLMRIESQQGFKGLQRVNQPIGSWPAGDVPYLYGVFFFEFVRDRYGEAAIKAMVDNYSSNIIPFRINSNAYSVFHKELPALWQEYRDWLNHKYASELAAIDQAGIRSGEQITQQGYVAGSLRAVGDKIFYYRFNGVAHPAIMVQQAKQPARVLLEVNQNARLSVSPQRGLLITQPEVCRNARLYFDIYRADLDGTHYQRLTRCARYRNAVWDAAGEHIIAAHNELGNNRLDLLDASGRKLETLWTGGDGEQIGEMASSARHAGIVATVWRAKSGWNLEQFDLQSRKWTALTRDRAIEAQPAFSSDGQSLFYSSDADGVYNIYRYDLDKARSEKITNVAGGAFFPALAGDRLAYIGYGVEGFDIYAMPAAGLAALPAVHETSADGPQQTQPPQPQARASKTRDSSAELPVADYSPWTSLAPRYWSPYLQFDDQHSVVGFETSGMDVLQRHQYNLTLAYDFKNRLDQGRFDYVYDGLWPILHLGFSRENVLAVDSNNNTVRRRDNDDTIAEAIVPFLSLEHNWFVHAALIKQFDHDVWTNGVAPAPDIHNDIAATAIRFISTKKYPLSISRNDGRDVRLIHEDTDVYGDSFNKGQVTVADWREFLHLGGEHVLALRLVEGRGQHNPSPFQLGGIQSDNTVISAIFNGEVQTLFNKRHYSLRGYSEGYAQLVGRNMRLISAEYRFPIDRVEYGWMAPPIGINQFYGTLFYDAGGVWNTGSGPDHYYTGAGFELNADLDVFYNVRLHTTLGFARGFDDTLGENKVYLRVGSQF